MTASVLQEKFADGSGSATTITISPSSGFTAGSALHVVATFADATTVTASVADGTNTYSSGLDIQRDVVNGQSQVQFRANNIASGTPTITVTFSSSVSFRGAYIAEIGAVTTTAADGSNGNLQAIPTTGTDAVTSGVVSNANQPALLNAVSLNSSGTSAPNGGTGFTSSSTGWGFGGTALARSENKRYTDTTGHAATYTATVNSIHMTHGFMFDESGGAFDVALMAAMNRPVRDIVFSKPKVVVSGMTPPDFIPL